MTTSTPTLTQSGLLAVLLQRQRRKVIQLARRRARTAPTLVHDSAEPVVRTVPRGTLESFTKPIAMSHPIHTYTELQQQIHDDLRIQHPEWVKLNGECPTCDSYEARLGELLDTFTRRGSDKSIAAIHRALEKAAA
jgi:hypothetical protein